MKISLPLEYDSDNRPTSDEEICFIEGSRSIIIRLTNPSREVHVSREDFARMAAALSSRAEPSE